jgi:transcriptional regulator with XRE-family HTH domain
MDNASTPSDQVARRVRELRTDRNMTVKDLAARCAEEGMPGLTAQTLYKLEAQRDPAKRKPRPVSVDELLVLARALDVPVSELLIGVGAAYGPMTAKGLRKFAAQIEKAAAELEASGITWGDDS